MNALALTSRTPPVTLPQNPVAPGLHHPSREPHPLDDPAAGFEDDGPPGMYDLPEGEEFYQDDVDRGYYEDESSAQDMDVPSTIKLGKTNTPTEIEYWLNYNDAILRKYSVNSADAKIQKIREFPRALSVKQRWCLACDIAKAYRAKPGVAKSLEKLRKKEAAAAAPAEPIQVEIERRLLRHLIEATEKVKARIGDVDREHGTFSHGPHTRTAALGDLGEVLREALVAYDGIATRESQYLLISFGGFGTTWAMTLKQLQDVIDREPSNQIDRRAVCLLNQLDANIPPSLGLKEAVDYCIRVRTPANHFVTRWNVLATQGRLMHETSGYTKHSRS